MYINKIKNKENFKVKGISYTTIDEPKILQNMAESIKFENNLNLDKGKETILFIDDFSMPANDKYGGYSIHELLRQLIEDGGYYNLNLAEIGNFTYLDCIKYLAAAYSKSGNCNIPNRLKRQFIVANMDQPTKLDKIFNSMQLNYLKTDDLVFDVEKMMDN